LKAGDSVPMPYPPIIEQDLFERVQARLRLNQRRNRGPAKHFYLLQNLGRCGECGGNMLNMTLNKGRGRYLYCLRQREYRVDYDCHSPKKIRLGPVEDYVWAQIESTLGKYRDGPSEAWVDEWEKTKVELESRSHVTTEKLEECRSVG